MPVSLQANSPLSLNSINNLNTWIEEAHKELRRHGDLKRNNLTPAVALCLYGRSLFLKERGIDKNHKAAVAYFPAQAKQHWLKLPWRQPQGHLVLALRRFSEQGTARGIVSARRNAPLRALLPGSPYLGPGASPGALPEVGAGPRGFPRRDRQGAAAAPRSLTLAARKGRPRPTPRKDRRVLPLESSLPMPYNQSAGPERARPFLFARGGGRGR
jgi:hypothetical protein